MTQPPNPETILGIDPGTLVTGYGLISAGPPPQRLCHGTIRIPPSVPIEQRLHRMHQELLALAEKVQPDLISVEEPYFGRSAKSSMAVGQAQAIALITAAGLGIPLRRYQPAQIKQRATGNGNASKRQLRQIIQATFQTTGPMPLDAADALAIALCAVSQLNEERVLASAL